MSRFHHTWIFIFSLLLLLFSTTSALANDPDRPRLGLSVSPLQASPLLLQHLQLAEGEGLMVSNVAVGSELEAAGLSQGDIILSIDGHPLSRPSDLTSYIANIPAHQQVTLDVIQKGEHRQIYLSLDNLPDEIVWKYAQPVASPRNRLSRRPTTRSQSFQVPQNNTQNNVASQMTFSSVISTDQGLKQSTVRITGAPDNPDSDIEVTLNDDTYQTKVGDIDSLPEDARTAAKSALSQSGSFSFSFGGSSMMDEMMQRHEAQMRMMDEFFNRQFGYPQQPSQPQATPENQKKSVLKPLDEQKPVQPSKGDIRS